MPQLTLNIFLNEQCVRDTNPDEQGTKKVEPAGCAGTISNMNLTAA